MKDYEGIGQFSFIMKAPESSALRAKIMSALRTAGLREFNLELKITKLTKHGQEAVSEVTDKPQEESNDKKKKNRKSNLPKAAHIKRAKLVRRKTHGKVKQIRTKTIRLHKVRKTRSDKGCPRKSR